MTNAKDSTLVQTQIRRAADEQESVRTDEGWYRGDNKKSRMADNPCDEHKQKTSRSVGADYG